MTDRASIAALSGKLALDALSVYASIYICVPLPLSVFVCQCVCVTTVQALHPCNIIIRVLLGLSTNDDCAKVTHKTSDRRTERPVPASQHRVRKSRNPRSRRGGTGTPTNTGTASSNAPRPPLTLLLPTGVFSVCIFLVAWPLPLYILLCHSAFFSACITINRTSQNEDDEMTSFRLHYIA
jgi:hypothetical protein